jgi:hypothetical protein
VKRTLVLALAGCLVATGAATATAAPKKPKPVTMTYYFHGTQEVGEVQGQTEGFGTMDATKPTGSAAKSYGVTNYVAGPNSECAGNSLYPVFVGNIDGAPTGNAELELFIQGAGSGSIEARIFADVFEQACNEAYVPPLASATFAVPNGPATVKVNLKNLNKKGKNFSSLMVQLSQAELLAPPFVARVQYDAASVASKLTFTCVPKAGKKTC